MLALKRFSAVFALTLTFLVLAGAIAASPCYAYGTSHQTSKTADTALTVGTCSDGAADLEECRHEWSAWEVARKATPYKAGAKERTCFLCGDIQTKAIPKRKMSKTEKKAVAVVKTYLKAAKAYNWKTMNKCFVKTSSKYGYPTVGKVAKRYRKFNKKMLKWKFIDLRKSGKSYVAYVKVTRPDGYGLIYDPYYNELVNTFDKYVDEYAVGRRSVSKDGERAGERAIKKYINALSKKGISETYTETVKVPVVKHRGKWKIKSKSMAVVDIATCYYNEGIRNAVKDFGTYVDDYISEYYS